MTFKLHRISQGYPLITFWIKRSQRYLMDISSHKIRIWDILLLQNSWFGYPVYIFCDFKTNNCTGNVQNALLPRLPNQFQLEVKSPGCTFMWQNPLQSSNIYFYKLSSSHFCHNPLQAVLQLTQNILSSDQIFRWI